MNSLRKAAVLAELRALIPTRKQWNAWTLPSKLTALGTLFGALSLLGTCYALIPQRANPDSPPQGAGLSYENFSNVSSTILDTAVVRDPSDLVSESGHLAFRSHEDQVDRLLRNEFHAVYAMAIDEVPLSDLKLTEGERRFYDNLIRRYRNYYGPVLETNLFDLNHDNVFDFLVTWDGGGKIGYAVDIFLSNDSSERWQEVDFFGGRTYFIATSMHHGVNDLVVVSSVPPGRHTDEEAMELMGGGIWEPHSGEFFQYDGRGSYVSSRWYEAPENLAVASPPWDSVHLFSISRIARATVQ